jgi:hypothetical protein
MKGIQNHLQLLKGGLKYSSLCKVNEFHYKTQLILEFSFAIPGTSTATERVFFITNALWTDEKSCFLAETIKSVIVTKNILRNYCAMTSIL